MSRPAARRGGPEPAARIVCRNRRARHDYEILETLEAGIALLGPEVKSLREGRASIAEAHARIRGGEVYLVKAHIAPYPQAGRENPDPERDRKLLLHRREIDRLAGRVRERGLALVPLDIHFTPRGHAKVTLALVRGKRRYDRRREIAEREARRRLDRAKRRARERERT